MMKNLVKTLAIVGVLGVVAGPVFAQRGPEGPVETQATVSVESKHEARLDASQVKVEVNGHQTPLTALTRIQPSTAQVAILIDDGLRSSFGTQVTDVQKFVRALPQGTQVLVGYMRNGAVVSKAGFSANHEAVAKDVRIPLSMAGASASPYFCLSDFVKKWPSQAAGPRFVLMLTNGVDPYNGSTSIMNQDSPYVETAQADAQRAGVAVYAIAYSDAGFRGGRGSFSGQSYLQQVADATGGRSFYNGFSNPVSLAPFLDDFRKSIAESYTATFMASASHEKPNTLTRLKISTSQPNLKIHAPDAVHPGAVSE